MQRLQEEWPEQYNATSSHEFRAPDDMQVRQKLSGTVLRLSQPDNSPASSPTGQGWLHYQCLRRALSVC